MNRMIRYYLLAFVLLPWTFVGAQTEITIEQCYQWAEANYPQIRQYGLIDQSEKYNLSNAAKNWLPQLSVNAKATYQSDVTKLPIDLSQLGVDFSIPTLDKDQYQVSAELSQTLWDGGTTSSTRAMTKAESEANRKNLQRDLYRLKEQVNQLFFGVLLQSDLLDQNLLLQKELRINIDRVDVMIRNGVANESDKELLEVELLNVKQKEIETASSRLACLTMLSYFTGNHELVHKKLKRPSVSLSGQMQQIDRPELYAFQAQEELAGSQNKAITAGLMPRFGAFVQAGYGRPGLNMLENEFKPFYIAGVRMSWNLGRLYTVKNDRRKVEVALRGIEVSRETFLFTTRMQLINQNQEIRKIAEMMRTDDEIIRLRSSVKKAAEAKLTHGVISVSDLVREINAEDMARQAAVIHQTQHSLAIYQLMYLTNNE